MIYLLPFLAVLLSFLLVLAVKPKNTDILKLLLAFSGAFLLALTIFELLPEVYEHGNPKQMGVFIIIGILLQIFLEFFSRGAEHGHIHHEKTRDGLPILLLVSLCLHAFVEGFSISEHNNMLYGVLVHKIPVAIIVSLFLVNSNIKTTTAFLAMGIFAIMTPLGNYLSENLPQTQHYSAPMTALVVGVFLHVSTVILFESSEGHTFNLRKFMVILAGIGTAYLL